MPIGTAVYTALFIKLKIRQSSTNVRVGIRSSIVQIDIKGSTQKRIVPVAADNGFSQRISL